MKGGMKGGEEFIRKMEKRNREMASVGIKGRAVEE
jgi:hypothetical protein